MGLTLFPELAAAIAEDAPVAVDGVKQVPADVIVGACLDGSYLARQPLV